MNGKDWWKLSEEEWQSLKTDEAGQKELFCNYDGSRFYMSRDGVESNYLRLGIPKEKEAEWLAELTAKRLQGINDPGNWKVVNFLINHGDYRHFAAVFGASPKGKLWERCAFLEESLKYLQNFVNRGIVPMADVLAALDSVSEHARTLKRRTRADESRRRVDEIIQETEKLMKK